MDVDGHAQLLQPLHDGGAALSSFCRYAVFDHQYACARWLVECILPIALSTLLLHEPDTVNGDALVDRLSMSIEAATKAHRFHPTPVR